MPCPTCSNDGEHFNGTPEAEALHYAQRVLWASHRLRQALAAKGLFSMSAEVSSVIKRLDSVWSRLVGRELH